MAQKLYRVTTQFWGKDLNEKAILGYVVAKTDLEVADHISKKYKGGERFDWGTDGDALEGKRGEYIANRGDFHTEYAGEFYDQKYGWEEIAQISDEQIIVLKTLGIVEDLAV